MVLPHPKPSKAIINVEKKKRNSLTPRQRASLVASIVCCPLCSKRIGDGGIIAEHTIPVALGNLNKPDTILCRSCAGLKTKKDMRDIAKVKRMRKHHETGRGRARRGAPLKSAKRPWPKRKMETRNGNGIRGRKDRPQAGS